MTELKHNAPSQVPPTGWFGPFYCNREDRRIILPKRWGFGWTFNFARPMTYVIFAVMMVVPAVIAVAIILAR